MSNPIHWFVPLMVAGCTGLYLDNGNAYPCNFSDGPGIRDSVCMAGDICGTNNVCQKYIYEGPRFEGRATVPVYGLNSGEGEVLHPLVLKKAPRTVSADLPVTRDNRYVQELVENNILQVKAGRVTPLDAFPNLFPIAFGNVTKTQTFFEQPAQIVPHVLFQDGMGRLAIASRDDSRAEPVMNGASIIQGASFRIIETPELSGGPSRAKPIAWTDTSIGHIGRSTLGGPWEFVPWTANQPKIFDVAGVALGARLWVLGLASEEVRLLDAADGGVSTAATLGALNTREGVLHTDPGSRIVAAVRQSVLLPLSERSDVLSTFQINIGATGPVLTSPWPDCVPCGGGQHIELVAPSVRTGSPVVEVVCAGAARLPEALRVVGSVALSQSESCITEQIALPLSIVNRVVSAEGRLVQWDNQSGLLVAGRRSELWSGETLSTLKPEFLDRVPRDVSQALGEMPPALAVIADDYLAIQQTDSTRLGPREQFNGFRRLSTRELRVAEDARLLSFIHGTNGWGIGNGGSIIRVENQQGVPTVQVGAQLVSASGQAIRDSIGGEAFALADGGLAAFFVAADDSVYFVQNPEAALGLANEKQLLTPDLTPEPSVPIRSLALERTPLGTDGVARARGYLVTSREVYAWALSGTPARWSSTPLVLGGGEPVEVWFDQPRSALGRVGYRDGQIYSLPGGYPLVETLPAADGGVPAQVIDFENLGGWPVAYATTGLFIAGWDQVDGKLQNRFPNGVNRPMTWREVVLPDGSRPWMRPVMSAGRAAQAKPGKLFVAVDSRVAEGPDAGLLPHRLVLFNDDEVRQVARHLRQ